MANGGFEGLTVSQPGKWGMNRMPQTVQNAFSDSSIVAWLIGMASSAVIFFLAWGLKDVKSRYDKVPELEKTIIGLQQKIADLEKRLP
jgi:hypothetical protein